MASASQGAAGMVPTELVRVLRWGQEELNLDKLSSSLGASEQALRLIISIFLGKDPPPGAPHQAPLWGRSGDASP